MSSCPFAQVEFLAIVIFYPVHLDPTLADLDDVADGALCSSFAMTGLRKRQDQRIGMVRTEPQTILQLILRLEGSTSGR